MAQSIFRKAALERLSTPEQLDRLVQITRPIGWFGLCFFYGVCLFGFIWSFWASFPVRISAPGMLVSDAGLAHVMATHPGRLKTLLVKSGETVVSGQAVAKIEQPELALELDMARSELREHEDKYRALLMLAGKEAKAQSRLDENQQKATLEAIKFKEDRIRWLLQSKKQEEKLVESGFITQHRAEQVQLDLNLARAELAQLQNELKQLDAQKLTLQLTREKDLLDSELRRNTARRKVAEIEQKLAEQQWLRSPYEGTVAELKVNSGELVQTGTSVFSVQKSQDAQGVLSAVFYVAPEDGNRVVPGMKVQVSPYI